MKSMSKYNLIKNQQTFLNKRINDFEGQCWVLTQKTFYMKFRILLIPLFIFLLKFEHFCKFVQQIVLKQTRYCMSNTIIPIQKQTQKTLDFRVKYKTQKCRFWYEKGFCPFNKFCAFAHTQQEIREKKQLNLKYKTKPCHNFFQNGYCKYGDRCQYLHSISQRTDDGDKTRSNSQQSYSSKSSTQCRSKNINLNRQQFKHRARFQMLKEKDFGLFQIMMGQSCKIACILQGQNENLDQQGIRIEKSEYYYGLGNGQQKKSRMYSL